VPEIPEATARYAAAATNHRADREAHWAFVATLGDKPIWNEFLEPPSGRSVICPHGSGAGDARRYDGLLALEDRLGGVVAGDGADAVR